MNIFAKWLHQKRRRLFPRIKEISADHISLVIHGQGEDGFPTARRVRVYEHIHAVPGYFGRE